MWVVVCVDLVMYGYVLIWLCVGVCVDLVMSVGVDLVVWVCVDLVIIGK